MEIFRKRLTYPMLKKAILQLRNDYSPRFVIVERNGTGISLIQDLEADGVEIQPYRAKEEKEVRAARASSPINAGRVFLFDKPDPTLTTFMDEVLAFPVGKHDDQVDSMVQAIDWWERQRLGPTLHVGRW